MSGDESTNYVITVCCEQSLIQTQTQLCCMFSYSMPCNCLLLEPNIRALSQWPTLSSNLLIHYLPYLICTYTWGLSDFNHNYK